MTIDFKDKVAIVTGAGGGLGRSHALELSKRGLTFSAIFFLNINDGTYIKPLQIVLNLPKHLKGETKSIIKKELRIRSPTIY